MEAVLLSALGGHSSHMQNACPPMLLDALDDHAQHLQTNAIKISTTKGYATGAQDYINFCLTFSLPLTPTPQNLSHDVTYTSKFIASAPKYLTGARHFLQELYPDFDTNCSHPLVQTTICGSKKVHTDPINNHFAPLT